NKGADAQPAYSPDGHWLAYVSQARAGFESDCWVLKVLGRRGEAGQHINTLSDHLDRPVQSFAWDPGFHGGGALRMSGSLIASIDDAGGVSLIKLGVPPEPSRRLVTGGVNTAAQVIPPSGSLVYVHGDAAHPGEIFTANADGSAQKQLTHHNTPLLSEL